MQKGMTVFMVGYAALMLGSAAAYILAGDNTTVVQLAGIGMAVLVFVLGFIAHRVSGAIGNPFNGLVMGKPLQVIAVWLGGILLGLLAVGLAVGLGFVQIDPEMGWFLQMSAEQASKQGNAVSASQLAGMKVVFQVMSIVGALIGPFFAAGIISLAFFPVYGWLGRRLLVKGLPHAFMVLGAFGIVGTAIGAFAPNPMIPEPNLALAIPLAALYGLALTAVCIWLFLMTNSAVVPALAFASFTSAFGACQLYYGDPQAHMVPPMGLADLIVLVIVAIGMWLTKVPGHKHMEVAAVAFDGTSLTSEQVSQIEAGRSASPQAAPQMQAEPDSEGIAAATEETAADSGTGDDEPDA
ncbi:hypothetical protein KDL29_09265 [bacterium]|nr:hypothetical protein [bacterium]